METIVTLNGQKYKLIKDYKEAFIEEDVVNKCTDYFENYDYIVGDVAYGKLRLKGFNSEKNKYFNTINDFSRADEYIKNNCAFGCSYFVLEKIQK